MKVWNSQVEGLRSGVEWDENKKEGTGRRPRGKGA